ncbi:SRPBCC family protein [Streptomyces sp. NBC_01373]|uniref:SRPBCC family protein n=1 Tax=unclassified Streptomyces TaxID=2593676 RepID=UPI00225397BD|nr:SRPBCC family protein [Streptomyces sp. NBC_01373]MCX4702693.1 SRPBCC family protein [Streptomyces sp. NBC_01373]
MAPIHNEITIDGPVEQTFDLITQVRFWPQWHVLTRSVTGTVQRPFLPGDTFTEFIRTAEGSRELTWEVAEYERAKRVTIALVDSPGTISYTFEEVPEGTLFRRTVDGSGSKESRTATSDTEMQSLTNLKALVENILAHEKKGPSFP